MAKTIKFNLNCDGHPIRTLEDLQNHFSIDDILDYYKNGLLARWLEVRGFEEELKAVQAITETENKEILKHLITIFDMHCDVADVERCLYILDY